MKMVVTRMMGVTAVAVMLAMGAGSAMAQTADSTTWEGSNEMDALPPFGEWEAKGDAGTVGSIVAEGGGNNYFHMPAHGNWDLIGSWNYVANAQTNGGASFEVRTRRIDGPTGSVGGHVITTQEDGAGGPQQPWYHWLTYYLDDGEIKINNTNSFNNDNATVPLDTSVWQTLRFTNDNVNWSLYIGDNPVPAATLPVMPTQNADPIPYDGYFAALWAPYGGASGDVDYLRYTDGGAFAAIPEPATMAVLGLGGSLMLRRMRRRNR